MTNEILPILRKAGKAILDIYQDEKLFATEFKGDQSPLTAADKRSNEIITENLNSLFPDIPVISEESKQIDYSERKKFKRYFLVDPLDGTKEFIKRNGEFTINIGYMENANAVAGFIFIPVTGKTYVAQSGQGAYRIEEDDTKTVLRSKPFFLLDKGIKVYASRSHRNIKTDNLIARLNDPEIINAGSALKFLRIAEGAAHFYPRLAPTMEWDTAAAQCILEEAGGSILKYEDLLPLQYNKEDLLNPGFIAMGALLDPETLQDML